ncbi:MAG: hypothetical protein N2319_01275 [Candidatus Kapabacteria bacterium]|nr:hypothetical protein [Candidatus Kapabacteria bacterium]
MFNLKLLIILLFGIFVALLFYSCSESSPTENDDHYEAAGLLLKQGNTVYMRIFQAKIDNNYNQSISLKTGQESLVFSVVFLDEDGKELPEPTDVNKSFGWVIDDNTVVSLEYDNKNKWSFRLKGLKEGTTNLELRLNHNDHPDFKTPKIPVVVGK